MVFRLVGRKLPPPPLEPTRLDRLTSEDLYLAMETALANSTHLADRYRSERDNRAQILALLETEALTTLQSCQALRRKHARVAD
jgi:hypothetical protein